MSPAELVGRWKQDFPLYARQCLKVLSKGGELQALHLNHAQRILLAFIVQTLEEVGRAWIAVPKGRQVGVSTFTAAYLYWCATLFPGRRIQVFAHRKDATSNLAEMTRRFHDQMEPSLQIPTVARNDTMLSFAHQSAYRLGTAGAAARPGAGGRSHTATHFHGSEFAYWEGAGDRIAALRPAIADVDGSVAIIESTAAGQANAFYDLWRLAEAGTTDWRGIFLPWFLAPEYSRSPPAGWQPSRDTEDDGTISEYEYGQQHDLTRAQLYWRRQRIAELSLGGEGMVRWKREYPATAEEAFVTSQPAAFINSFHVADARSRTIDLQFMRDSHLVLGVDPATSHGTNASAFIWRKGRKAFNLEEHYRLTPDQVAGKAFSMWQEQRPRAVCVDRGEGVGDHVFQTLWSRGVPVIGVYFGGTPDLRERFYDRRAEIYSRLAAWLPEADIPDEVDLAKDLLAQRRYPDEKTRIRLVSKPDLLKDGLPSPDRSDALALTFAYVDPEPGAAQMGRVELPGWRDLPPGAPV